jgi:hypothetical protein
VKRLAALLTLVLGLAAANAARAGSLTLNERAWLEEGATISRPVTIDEGERRLVGGVTYTVLDASIAELNPLFDDENAYKELLPRTLDARLRREGQARIVDMRTGNALMEGAYSLYLRRESEREVRFWLDRRAHHDIDDAFGYFRFTELEPSRDGRPRTLLTYAIAIDVGPGIVRDMFEERIRAASLALPRNLVARLSREHPDAGKIVSAERANR